jgi:Holliday junction DNA helicase RuvA
MIAFLRGQIISVDVDSAIVETNGVGYEINCSTNTLADFTAGKKVEVFVYTHVREDALQLYGFSTRTEKELFLSLNKVNGIGPKLAQKILSGARVDQLVGMIEAEDVGGLSKLPKVGKKTAEQMILSLKGKLVVDRELLPQLGVKKDIVSALVNLGFRLGDVEKVVEKMSTDMQLEDGVRKGLQALTNL